MKPLTHTSSLLLILLPLFPGVLGNQLPLASSLPGARKDDYYRFSHDIKRVAVIGAGPSGLQAAASLVEAGFEVRLFERADQPGGNWYYRDQPSVHTSFPSKPIPNSSYTPDIPHHLPHVHIYHDGEDGISNSWRLREHEAASAVWESLHTISPRFINELPNVGYPTDLSWKPNHRYIQRAVRQYASSVGLNKDDEEYAHITSYSTRVERVHKPDGSPRWTLTLRKVERIPHSYGKVRAEWWTEEFDAVVVATGTFETPYIPSTIPNLDKWAAAYPDRIYHSREYRKPTGFVGKNVLIVGGSISAYGIAMDLLSSVNSISISVRGHPGNQTNFKTTVFSRLPANVTIIPEIKEFEDISAKNHDKASDIRGLSIRLVNGTTVSGYDHIIFATGWRRSDPFLVDFHNTTIKGFDEPETKIAPIITDGTHVRSLHWTGHYISDPTLAIMDLVAWTLARYQVLGFARVWARKARLPNTARMWETYPGAGKELVGTHGQEELYSRLFISWLNNEALEFGGRLVAPLPRNYDALSYFFEGEYGTDLYSADFLRKLEHIPRSEWPSRNGGRDRSSDDRTVLTEQEALELIAITEAPFDDQSWAEWNLRW